MPTAQSFKSRIYQWLLQKMFSRKRRLLIKTSLLRFLKQSDVQRWTNPESLYADWEDRTNLMAQWIPDEVSVMEFGCGNMALKKYLPQGVFYTPSDIVLRNQETLVIDLNQRAPLSLPCMMYFSSAVF